MSTNRDQFEDWHKKQYGYIGGRNLTEYRTSACQHRWESWHAAYAAGRKSGLQDAADEVLKDLVPNPKTEYQEQYNHTLMTTANRIRSLE